MFNMKYQITNDYITNKLNRPQTKAKGRTFGVAHDTGNKNSTAKSNVKYMNRKIVTKNGVNYEDDGKTKFRVASAHVFIDDKDIIVCIPLEERAYHVVYNRPLDNELFGGDSNDYAVGIEMCFFDDKARTKAAYQKFVWYWTYLVYKYKWDVNNLRKYITFHSVLDPANKTDPMTAFKTIGITYDTFLKDVANEYKACNGISTPNINVTNNNDKYNGVIMKDRVYASNGVLKYVNGDYKTAATDVRHIKLEKGKYKLKLVWEKGAKVSDLVKKYGADYGINFPFFYNGNPVSDLKIGDKVIQSVSTGKTVAWNGLKYNNGLIEIGKVNINDTLSADGFICKGTPLLIENGSVVYKKYINIDQTADDIANSRCQRTLIGKDSYGHLHIAIADGRNTYDRGLSMEECALYMKDKGCVTALNGDGGGSTILADKNGGINQSLNTGANERVVNHALLIFIDKEDKPVALPQVQKEVSVVANNGELTTKGYTINNSTYVPVRAISEFFGATVLWDSKTNTVKINK